MVIAIEALSPIKTPSFYLIQVPPGCLRKTPYHCKMKYRCHHLYSWICDVSTNVCSKMLMKTYFSIFLVVIFFHVVLRPMCRSNVPYFRFRPLLLRFHHSLLAKKVFSPWPPCRTPTIKFPRLSHLPFWTPTILDSFEFSDFLRHLPYTTFPFLLSPTFYPVFGLPMLFC